MLDFLPSYFQDISVNLVHVKEVRGRQLQATHYFIMFALRLSVQAYVVTHPAPMIARLTIYTSTRNEIATADKPVDVTDTSRRARPHQPSAASYSFGVHNVFSRNIVFFFLLLQV